MEIEHETGAESGGAVQEPDLKSGQSKVTITLKLSLREMKVLEDLAEKKELTKVAVIRQALRLYQLLDARLAQGEKLLVEDSAGEKTTELMML